MSETETCHPEITVDGVKICSVHSMPLEPKTDVLLTILDPLGFQTGGWFKCPSSEKAFVFPPD